MSYYRTPKLNQDKKLHAYIIGIALGDGNLSNQNGRAIRLRITCDKKYPILIKKITASLKSLLPENKISFFDRGSCIDISLYSNHWADILNWEWNKGPKDKQNIGVPKWIKEDGKFSKECLRGLLQTDGSIYKDRKYLMVNFVNTCPNLSEDVFKIIKSLGYKPNIQKFIQKNGKIKHTVRLSRDSQKFIKEINFWKK
jgi:hypothetical protein